MLFADLLSLHLVTFLMYFYSCRSLESESEALLRQKQNRASMAKKRALEPESEVLLRKEHDRASKAKKRALEPESEAILEENKTGV